MKERRDRSAVLSLPCAPLCVGQALERVTLGMLCRAFHRTGWILLDGAPVQPCITAGLFMLPFKYYLLFST